MWQIAVIHHDNTLDRCTNGSGKLLEHEEADITALDAGSHYSADFAGERIPLLIELLECCRELALGLILEVKNVTEHSDDVPTAQEAAMEEELTDVVCAVIMSSKFPAHKLMFCSYSRTIIGILRRTLPHIPCVFNVKDIPRDWSTFVDEHKCSAVSFWHASRTATREQITAMAMEVPLLSFTVNDKDRALELTTWGVSAIYTDYPAEIEASLAKALDSPSMRGRSMPRAKSWKDLSLDSVVDGALAFAPPS